MDLRLGYLFEKGKRWSLLSIINSFSMVIFLSNIVFRHFHRNVSREIIIYNQTIDEGSDIDSGWKQLRGYMFRPATHINLFCARIGTGIQIILMAIFTITFSSIGSLRPEHWGALLSMMLLLWESLQGAWLEGYTRHIEENTGKLIRWLCHLLSWA